MTSWSLQGQHLHIAAFVYSSQLVWFKLYMLTTVNVSTNLITRARIHRGGSQDWFMNKETVILQCQQAPMLALNCNVVFWLANNVNWPLTAFLSWDRFDVLNPTDADRKVLPDLLSENVVAVLAYDVVYGRGMDWNKPMLVWLCWYYIATYLL